MTKIKSLCIEGFRGIKENLTLDLNSKSVLLLGDNGTGKSSITDAIEWYYQDFVEHLSKYEIDRKRGLTALRNIFIADTEKCSVDINFTKDNCNSKKSMVLKKDNLEVEDSNDLDVFKEYIKFSRNENLILKYEDLKQFVGATKKEKLDSLSKVIGFTKISNIRGILKKATNDIKKSLQLRNFDNEISIKDGKIMTLFNERIVSDDQYINKIEEIIKPLSLEINLNMIEDINDLLSLFKRSDDSGVIEQRAYYNETISRINNLKSRISNLMNLYEIYYQLFQEVTKDIEILKKIALCNLWNEGLKILKGSIIDKDECPLCLQPKQREKLKKEIELRLKTLESIEKQTSQLDDARKDVQNVIDDIRNILTGIQSTKYFNLEGNIKIRDFVDYNKKYISLVSQELSIDILKGQRVKDSEKLKFEMAKIDEMSMFCQERNRVLESQIKGNKILEIQDKIILSQQAYLDIKKLKKEKEIIEKQKKSMEIIYNAFVQKQKEEMDRFVNNYSAEINAYYQYMHPGEKIDNIEIKTTEKNDELTGITIEYKFFNKTASPPQKYLSESHLNSLGIAFFLTSVKAFNKRNKFFILDDIISSFDLNHRKRLGDLLLEKFSDYQVFILTHERNWFSYMKNVIQGKADWLINVINWNESKGTHLNETLVYSKRTIEQKLIDNDEIGLGNLMRKYLEKLLKEISEEIEVYVKYHSNEINENRMSNELLCELKSKIKKQPSKEMFESIIEKMLKSIFIGNKDSHYDNFNPGIGDCRSFWQDLENLEKLFYCEKCNKSIAKKYYDKVKNTIRCKCGNKKYDWKV